MKEAIKEINDLFYNYEKCYKLYNKNTILKAVHIDINNILDKYIPKTKYEQQSTSRFAICCDCKEKHEIENLFLYNEKLYCSWCLMYKLSDDGIITLSHNDFEEEGVKVIL